MESVKSKTPMNAKGCVPRKGCVPLQNQVSYSCTMLFEVGKILETCKPCMNNQPYSLQLEEPMEDGSYQ